MRIFSRIGTWLRGNTASGTKSLPLEGSESVLDPELLARLPRTPATAFSHKLKEALEASRRQVQVCHLDPSVRLIALSQRELGDDAEIDNALRAVEAGAVVTWSSLTWSALRDSRPPFSPGPAAWAGELSHLLDGDAGLIFFVDVEAIATAVAQAAERRGFSAIVDADGALVRVSDGRFCAEISTGGIIAEALWTGSGPLAAVMRRAEQLPHELRSFTAFIKALERAFPGAHLEVTPDELFVRRKNEAPIPIDYRHWAASMRQSGVSGDVFLEGADLFDLRSDNAADFVVLLRSQAWAKAWPDKLWRHDDAMGSTGVIALGSERDGRVSPISRSKQQNDEQRFTFLEREARRQLSFLRVQGHAFFIERHREGKGVERALGVVSDRSASLLLDASLIRGLCEHLGAVPATVEVACSTENLIVLAAEGTSEATLDEALRKGAVLEADLCEGGTDAISVRRTITLPAKSAGFFDLTVVTDDYFALCERASAATEHGRTSRDFLRGLAYELIGKKAHAVGAFERAARKKSDDGEVHLALGRALTDNGEHDRAVTVLGLANNALPDRGEVHNALGLALYRSGAVTDARAAFLRAVQLSPDEVGYLVNLGRTCCDEEMFTEANAVLEHALRMEPQSAEAHASMAVLCHRTGRRERALHHARAALAEHPDDDTMRELLRIVNDDG